jgi:hypothetical protein
VDGTLAGVDRRVTPVRTLDEALEDPQFAAHGCPGDGRLDRSTRRREA